MKKWNCIIEYYSDFDHKFVNHIFKIDDLLYDKIQALIKNDVLLKHDDIIYELICLAETSFKQEKENGSDYFCINSIFIDDPVELNNFKKAVVGKQYKNDGRTGEVAVEYDYVGDHLVENIVVFIVDDNHIIQDVKSIVAYIVNEENEDDAARMPYVPLYERIIDDITEDDKRLDNEVKTYFKITGDFNPEDITKILCLQPVQTWVKGEKRKISKVGNYTFSLWEFGVIEKKNNLFANKQMLETIKPLFEKIDSLNELKKIYNLNYVLEVVPKFYTDLYKPILSPLKEVIDFCSQTGTLLDIDYYFYFNVFDKNEE